MTKLEKNKAFLDSMIGTKIKINAFNPKGEFVFTIKDLIYSEKDNIYVIMKNDEFVELIREHEIDFYDFRLADDSLSHFYNDNHEVQEKSEFEIKLSKIMNKRIRFLSEKNKKYGNSALEPLSIFGKHINEGQNYNSILLFLDTKLARIKNSENGLRPNDIIDLAGYLDLLIMGMGIENFEEYLE